MQRVDAKGLDEIQQKLKDLAHEAEKSHGEHRVPLGDLLTNSFIAKYTKFSSANEMFKAGGFVIESQDDLERIPNTHLDEYVQSISQFDSWRGMIEKASEEWVRRKLGFGVG